MEESYDIVIIIKNLSYKSFDVEFKSLRQGEPHFIFRKYKNELLEIIDGVASSTFYKNNEGFSNRMCAAFVYFIETVLKDQFYTRACVLLDVPWVSQDDCPAFLLAVLLTREFKSDQEFAWLLSLTKRQKELMYGSKQQWSVESKTLHARAEV